MTFKIDSNIKSQVRLSLLTFHTEGLQFPSRYPRHAFRAESLQFTSLLFPSITEQFQVNKNRAFIYKIAQRLCFNSLLPFILFFTTT